MSNSMENSKSLTRLLQIGKLIITGFKPAVISVIVLTLLYRLIFNIESFQQTVNSITPTLVGIFCILLFKEELGEKIVQLFKLKLGKHEANFQRNTNQAQEEIATQEFADVFMSAKGEEFSKTDVEEIMKMSAAWGYNMSRMGFKSTPIPHIDWEGSSPRIKFGSSESGLSDQVRAESELLVAQIIATQEEIDSLSVFQRMGNTGGIMPTRESVLRKKLIRLKTQLREINPQSTFARE